MAFQIRLRSGRICRYDHPVVMGIINITPDSFFAGSRTLTTDCLQEAEQFLRSRVINMIKAGAEMIDVGACSTRPGYTPPSSDEELHRLEWGLPIVSDAIRSCTTPEQTIPVSVDTYRASVAEAAIERLGADIINDVYGGTREPAILEVVARTGAPYILTADSNDVAGFFRQQIAALKRQIEKVHGENASSFLSSPSSLILDPGYGFSKNVEENYLWMRNLSALIAEFREYPMLVGISRKSMIFRLLGTDPDHSLNGTTVLNTYSLLAGAHILRVHDVPEAIECVRIVSKLK